MTLPTIILMTLPAMTIWADDAPAISSAVVDYEARQVAITGSNFSPAGLPPTLAFARSPLALVSFTNQTVAASLPAGVSPGSYLLAVTNSNNQTGTFSLTLKAAPAPVVWDASDKLRYHAKNTFGPLALAGTAAYAGLLQELNAPREWGQTLGAYGRAFCLHHGYRGYPRSAGFWTGCDAAPGSAILSFRRQRILAANSARTPGYPAHANR